MQLLESCIWLEKEDKGERQLGTEREKEKGLKIWFGSFHLSLEWKERET